MMTVVFGDSANPMLPVTLHAVDEAKMLSKPTLVCGSTEQKFRAGAPTLGYPGNKQ